MFGMTVAKHCPWKMWLDKLICLPFFIWYFMVWCSHKQKSECNKAEDADELPLLDPEDLSGPIAM